MADRYALIDGDIFLYRSLFNAEETHDWGDGNFSLTCNLDQAAATFRSFMQEIERKAKADLVIAMSDRKENWRKAIWPDYKKPRASHRKPINLDDLREIVSNEYRTILRPALEADDVLGILMTDNRRLKGKKLCVSKDKDMLQIPGAHYNPQKPKHGVVKMSEWEADYMHFFQTLTGDPVDNYPGCPGIGEKRAKKILDGAVDVWLDIVRTFEKKGLEEEDALTQAQVARICRAEDYDFKNRKVIPWTPG